MLLVRLLASVLIVAAALAASVVAAASVSDRRSEPADESVKLRATAVRQLSLTGMAIGDRREGVVQVTTAGSGAAAIVLQANVTGSRELARQLQVSVFDRARGAARGRIYEGPLASLESVEVAQLAAGEQRTYVLVVRFPSTGTPDGDNALQGLAARLTLTWSAVQSSAR